MIHLKGLEGQSNTTIVNLQTFFQYEDKLVLKNSALRVLNKFYINTSLNEFNVL